jgi:predicted PurR-regulated permease PerM
VDYFRASRETRYALDINDPTPLESGTDLWVTTSHAATIGIFLLVFGACLYIGRPILLPIFAAALVATTFAPLVRRAQRHGIWPWLSAVVIVAVLLGVVAIAATGMAGPVSAWISRAPEIGATIKEKLTVLEGPLNALRQLEQTFFGGDGSLMGGGASASNVVLPVVAFVTPAAGELLLFFGTLLFFLVGQLSFRSTFVAFFSSRDGKLRFLKIMNDIEHNLTGYLTVVSVINAGIGIIVGIGTWLLGFPNPVIFGVLAAFFNYVPYVGPAAVVVVLFGVGLVTFPSLSHALIAPLCFVALTTVEGHFITPAIVGRRLTLNPLLVVLALAFWTWLWGPFGAFLATPLLIVGLVVLHHLFPSEDVKLPD